MSKILRYGIAVALPPVGVFLTYGLSPALLINIPLTLLGWLPGSIHAVWAIAKHNGKNSEKNNALQNKAVPTDNIEANA